MATDNQLEQLKQKYASVLTTIQQQQIRLSHVHIQDNKLFIEGLAPSEQAKNKVWDQIKLVNPNWAQELTADISVDPNAKPAQAQGASVSGGQQRTYTVKPGDSLSKISKSVQRMDTSVNDGSFGQTKSVTPLTRTSSPVEILHRQDSP